MIADSAYEIPVWFDVTQASASECRRLSGAVDELFEKSPSLAKRCADFSADRGLDSGPLKAKLWDRYRIRPLIATRAMWREEKAMPDYDPSKPILRSLDRTGWTRSCIARRARCSAATRRPKNSVGWRSRALSRTGEL